jgi:hypothetical protein
MMVYSLVRGCMELMELKELERETLHERADCI